MRITCANCQETLEIDDGFAGGVCRCSACGKIQAVPALKKSRRAATPAEALGASPGAGSGSGLANVSAQSIATEQSASEIGIPSKSGLLVPILVGIVALAAIAFAVWFIFIKDKSPAPNLADQSTQNPANSTPPNNPDKPATPVNPTKPPDANPPAASGPNFAGVGLQGDMILFLIDRDARTADTFTAMKSATHKSLASLGPQTRFKLVFWEAEDYFDIPKSGILYATPENVAVAAAGMKSLAVTSATTIGGPVEKGITKNPTAIVIATGKSDLDEPFVDAVLSRRAKSKVPGVPIHTFSFGQNDSAPALRKIAEKTNGQFRQITGDQLKSLESP